MAKKILIFSLTYDPFIGGAEVAIKEITKRLPELEFTLLTARLEPTVAPEEQQGNVRIIRLGGGHWTDKYLFAFRAVIAAKRLHHRVNFNLSWAMMVNYAALAAWMFRVVSKVPYVMTEQSGDSDEFIRQRTWFWLPVYRSLYKKAVHIQAISKSLADRARSYGYKGEISLIPNGVDVDLFQNCYSAEERLEIRQRLGIQQEDFVVVTTSRLVLKNAVDDLIKAINIGRFKFGLPLKLFIVGDGKDRQHLEQLTDYLGIRDYVRFCGHLEQGAMLDYLAASDIFCRPSLTEGLGNSFLEAMAFGLPVIATPVGGIKDFLRDGETGLLCQPRNPLSIVQALQRYYRDRSLYVQIQAQGQKLVADGYQWSTIAPAMGNILVKYSL